MGVQPGSRFSPGTLNTTPPLSLTLAGLISEAEFAAMMSEVDLLLKGIIMSNECKKLACCIFPPIIGCCFIGFCLDGTRPCCPTSKMQAQCKEATAKMERWNTPQLQWGVDFNPLSNRFAGADPRVGQPVVYMKTPGAEPNIAQKMTGQATAAMSAMAMMGGSMSGLGF